MGTSKQTIMVSALIFKLSICSTFILLSMSQTPMAPPACETSDCAVSGSQLVAQLDDCDAIYDGNSDCQIAAYEFCVSQLLDTQKKNGCVCDPNTCSGGGVQAWLGENFQPCEI